MDKKKELLENNQQQFITLFSITYLTIFKKQVLDAFFIDEMMKVIEITRY